MPTGKIFSRLGLANKEVRLMKNRRHLAAVVFAGAVGAVTLGSGITTFAATGWVQNGDSYVYYDNDGSLHKGWINTSKGYYYMDLSTGLMTVGWKKINDKWYFFNTDGLMATGWVNDGGPYY